MYRKQVRRRRAVLALLIVGSFVLLTITYGSGSNGLQRGVSTIFSPVQSVADGALKPARDLVNWFDQTFDARGRNSRLHDRTAGRRASSRSAPTRRWPKTRSCASCSQLDRGGAIPSGYDAGYGKGDRALPDRLVLRRHDRRRQRRRRRGRRPGRQRRRPRRHRLRGHRRLRPGDPDRRPLQRRLGQGRAGRRPGRDPAQRRRPRRPHPRLHRLDQARPQGPGRGHRRLARRRASNRASRPTSRSAK